MCTNFCTNFHELSHTLLKPKHTFTTSLWEFMVGGQVYTCLYGGGYGGNKVISSKMKNKKPGLSHVHSDVFHPFSSELTRMISYYYMNLNNNILVDLTNFHKNSKNSNNCHDWL